MTVYHITSPVADVCSTPDKAASPSILRGQFETQLVFGETFTVDEEKNGWCRGRCAHDGYAGYVESRHLTTSTAPGSHVVTAGRSHLYMAPTIKSPLIHTLSFGSLVTLSCSDRGFAQIDNGAWIYQKHLAPISMPDNDYIATAVKFLETPYYWGGRSGFGMDCSGLVQVSLARAGISVPRDSGLQKDALGYAVDKPQAGDIVFFQGHVGMMVDATSLIHANAFHMKVTIEPLDFVVRRGGGIVSIRRFEIFAETKQ